MAELCGLSVEDLDPDVPPQVASTGTAFAIVLLKNLEALQRLKVKQEESGAWLWSLGARWFYVLAPEGDGFRARMQFNGGEDPATGSAAGCAVSYLVKRGVATSGQRFPIRQGVEIGRPSELFVRAQREDVRVVNVCVAGSTVLVAKGTLFLP